MSDLLETIERLEKLQWEATFTPWQFLEEPNPSNGTFEQRHPEQPLAERVERTLATAYNHPQLKSPAQIMSIAHSPYFERPQFLSLEKNNAEFIVATVNALRDLLAAAREAEALRAELEQAQRERDAVLEEAAQLCERLAQAEGIRNPYGEGEYALDVIAAENIRKLKAQQPPAEGESE